MRKQDAIPEKRDWNYSRRSHVRSSKALNLVAKLRMNASCCIIAITRAFKKYRLHSVPADSVFIRERFCSLRSCDPHSVFVTNTAFFTPFLYPPTPFL